MAESDGIDDQRREDGEEHECRFGWRDREDQEVGWDEGVEQEGE